MRVMHRKRRGFRRLGRPVFGRGYALPQITSLQENTATVTASRTQEETMVTVTTTHTHKQQGERERERDTERISGQGQHADTGLEHVL